MFFCAAPKLQQCLQGHTVVSLNRNASLAQQLFYLDLLISTPPPPNQVSSKWNTVLNRKWHLHCFFFFLGLNLPELPICFSLSLLNSHLYKDVLISKPPSRPFKLCFSINGASCWDIWKGNIRWTILQT